MILNCVIVEDEKHAIELLEDHIKNMPNLNLLKVFYKPVVALSEISIEDKIDIIFMDINMPGINGIELARVIRTKTRFLIFTTAYDNYAIQAFDVEADQYIIKPVTLVKLALAIDKIVKKIDNQSVAKQPKLEVFLKAGVKNKVIKVNILDVIILESKDNYIAVVTSKATTITYLTLKEAQQIFDHEDNLIQVHKSYIVAKDKIQSLEGNTICMENGSKVLIGSSYRNHFFEYIKKNTKISSRIKHHNNQNPSSENNPSES